MGELNANRGAVGGLQLRDDFAQGQHFATEKVTGVEDAVGRDAVEAEGLVGEFEVGRRFGERVEAGLLVAERSVGVDSGEDLPLGGSVDASGGGHRAFGRLGRQAHAELEALEEGAPFRVHGGRVLGPLFVIRGYEVRVPAGSDAKMFHFFACKRDINPRRLDLCITSPDPVKTIPAPA